MADLSGFLFATFVGAVICGFIGGAMLGPFDKAGTGFALGFLLGPIGLVAAWVVRSNIEREQEAYRRRHAHDDPARRVRGGGFGAATRAASRAAAQAPAPSAAPVAVVQQIEALERLASLRERGALTEEEFSVKKRELLTTAAQSTATRSPR